MDAYKTQGNHIMNFKKILPLLLAATLATAHVHAEDGFNFVGGDAQAEKPAKAPREKNDGHYLETMAKSFGTGVGVGVAGGAVLGAAVVLNPLFIVGGSLVIGGSMIERDNAKTNVFYTGSVVRGKVTKVGYKKALVGSWHSMEPTSLPDQHVFNEKLDLACLDVDGPSNAMVCAAIFKGIGIQQGDVIDVKLPVGVFVANGVMFKDAHFDFNKHYPRLVSIYCKHDNPICQNDYESSLGVLYRHTDTEFPPSQYLIDPAIIAAGQAKARKDEEERKAAASSGSFNLM
jgi:hypothetical protein